jgi:SAM-dependent methyltransferase
MQASDTHDSDAPASTSASTPLPVVPTAIVASNEAESHARQPSDQSEPVGQQAHVPPPIFHEEKTHPQRPVPPGELSTEIAVEQPRHDEDPQQPTATTLLPDVKPMTAQNIQPPQTASKEATFEENNQLKARQHDQTQTTTPTIDIVDKWPDARDTLMGEDLEEQKDSPYVSYEEQMPLAPNAASCEAPDTTLTSVDKGKAPEGQHVPIASRAESSDVLMGGSTTEFQNTLQITPGSAPSEQMPQPQDGDLSFGSQSGEMAIDDTTDESTTADDSLFEQQMDTFSDYESAGSASFYSSLLSYATDYYWENGRRYHAYQGGRYPLPNDETELDREDMKHHEWMLITDFRHHLAPIGPNPQRILDIGTGTGIWAMQVAELYPSAEVIGTDISPVQPKWVPPNLTFEVDDLDEEWLYRPNSHDLIHLRFMFISVKDWPSMLAQAYRTLKPGGYIELSDLATLPVATNPDYPQPVTIPRWLDLLSGAMARMGLNMRVARDFKDLLTEAGFVDVVETKFEVPWGMWGKTKREKAIGFWHLGGSFMK